MIESDSDRITRMEARFDAFVDRYERDQDAAKQWRVAANDKLDKIWSYVEQGRGVARAVGWGRAVLLFLATIAGLLGLPKLAMWLSAAGGK